ncbi:iron permease [Mycena olivaceomarginata]|nr:iron permease [Mycena olivaceomarginata]
MSFLAIMVANFSERPGSDRRRDCPAIVATALNDTKADYIWVGSAYAMASTAFIPLSGSLADAKPIMLLCIAFFAIGSVLAGASQNMTSICLSRQSLFVLVLLYLSVRRPEGSLHSKLAQVDWIGNLLVVTGTTLSLIGTTWAEPVSRGYVQVLTPLLLGLGFLCAFVFYEVKVPISRPTIPIDVLVATAAHSVVSMSVIYYLSWCEFMQGGKPNFSFTPPVFFQACFGASPLRSAVDYLPGSLVGPPFAFLAGAVITISRKYRPVNWTARSGSGVGYQVIGAAGLGCPFLCPIFPILAPFPTNRAASALALFSFTRALFQTWGITVSSTILQTPPQNMLQKTLPPAFTALFSPEAEVAYAAIPAIRDLDEALRKEVQRAFAESMAVIWETMIGVSALGLLVSLMMEEVPMGTTVDENYALRDERVVSVSPEVVK